ncbi:unnamed protein product [Linum trigynum]|uniref:Uncharacterized protein n=1 Tax=Linum trigynum TaxID=586398 RepID=A0AAV2FQQ7_9ROSI
MTRTSLKTTLHHPAQNDPNSQNPNGRLTCFSVLPPQTPTFSLGAARSHPFPPSRRCQIPKLAAAGPACCDCSSISLVGSRIATLAPSPAILAAAFLFNRHPSTTHPAASNRATPPSPAGDRLAASPVELSSAIFLSIGKSIMRLHPNQPPFSSCPG